MYRGSSLLPIKYRKMFANGLILPHFDYLDTIYGRASKTKLSGLDILYKKVAKIALGVDRSENSMTVYKDMKWLPLHLRRQLHPSSYMLKLQMVPTHQTLCINFHMFLGEVERELDVIFIYQKLAP